MSVAKTRPFDSSGSPPTSKTRMWARVGVVDVEQGFVGEKQRPFGCAKSSTSTRGRPAAAGRDPVDALELELLLRSMPKTGMRP